MKQSKQKHDYKLLSQSYYSDAKKPVLVVSHYDTGDALAVVVNEGVELPTKEELRSFIDITRPKHLQYMCVCFYQGGKNYVTEVNIVELFNTKENEIEKKQTFNLQGEQRRNKIVAECMHKKNGMCTLDSTDKDNYCPASRIGGANCSDFVEPYEMQ